MSAEDRERKQNREAAYDCIRVIAMLFVVAIHTPRDQLSDIPFFNVVFNAVLFTCNGMFYMLSGKFNLGMRFEMKEDYIRYYKKRFVSVLLPFTLVSFALYLYDIRTYFHSMTFLGKIKGFYIYFFDTGGQTHLWFMYPLIGMLLGAPFLSKMVHAMSEFELRLCLIVGMIWNVAMVYLASDLDIGYGFSGWLLASWVIYFFLGYYCSVIDLEKCGYWICIAGAAGGILTVAQNYFLPGHSKYINDLAPLYILFTVGVYVFLLHILKERKTSRWVMAAAKHSFTVYLIHVAIMDQISDLFGVIGSPLARFGLRFLACILLSLGAAAAIDGLLLNPVKRLCGRGLGIQVK